MTSKRAGALTAAIAATFGQTADTVHRLVREVSTRLECWSPAVAWIGEWDPEPAARSPLHDLAEWYENAVAGIAASGPPPEAGMQALAECLDVSDGYESSRLTLGYWAVRVAEDFARLRRCIRPPVSPGNARLAVNRLDLTFSMAIRQSRTQEPGLRRRARRPADTHRAPALRAS
jgi:hypothetical protein